MLKKKELSVGFIGYGNMALKRLKAINSLKKYKINIEYIIDKKIKQNKSKNHFKNWSKIPNIKIDLLIISIQTNEVKRIPFSLLKSSKSLLIEKPVSKNLNFFNKLKSFCSKNKILLKTGYNLRFDEGLKKIKKLIESKQIGKLYYVKINYSNGTAKTNNNKIGSLFDMGCHSINLLQWILETKNFKNYQKILQKNEFDNRKTDDNGFVLMKTKNIVIQMQFGFCSWKNTFELEIIGSKGYLKVDSLPKWDKQIVTLGKRKYPSGHPIIKEWQYNRDLSFVNEMKFLLANIVLNKFNKEINNEGYETLKCLQKIK